MKRDKEQQAAEEPMEARGFGDFLLAIPWWFHLALGAAGYLILHALAGREIPLPDQSPDETALFAHRLVWKTSAAIFQYIVPAAFGLAAVFSFGRKRNKRKG
ncbi:hypothetical protein ACFL6N_04480 [Thermodesulfobacteriota bacterium]